MAQIHRLAIGICVSELPLHIKNKIELYFLRYSLMEQDESRAIHRLSAFTQDWNCMQVTGLIVPLVNQSIHGVYFLKTLGKNPAITK